MNYIDRLDSLYPDVKARCLGVMEEMAAVGAPVFPTQTLRTWEDQAALYTQGRTKPGPVVTNAKAGDSLHNYGLACDFAFVSKDPYAEAHPWSKLGLAIKKHGMVWGGDFKRFKDRPHAEMTYGLSLDFLRASMQQLGKLGEVWRAIDRMITSGH